MEQVCGLVNVTQTETKASVQYYQKEIESLPDFLMGEEVFFITARCPPDTSLASNGKDEIFLFFRFGEDGSWAHLDDDGSSPDELVEFLFSTIQEKFPSLPWNTLGLLSQTEIS
jgi:hypothetical protein